MIQRPAVVIIRVSPICSTTAAACAGCSFLAEDQRAWPGPIPWRAIGRENPGANEIGILPWFNSRMMAAKGHGGRLENLWFPGSFFWTTYLELQYWKRNVPVPGTQLRQLDKLDINLKCFTSITSIYFWYALMKPSELNENELAVKLAQLVNLHAQERPEKQTECLRLDSFFIVSSRQEFKYLQHVPIFCATIFRCI